MKSLNFILISILLVPFVINAQTTSTSSFYQKLKESPLKLDIMTQNMSIRDRKQNIVGADNMFDLFPRYKLTDRDSLCLDLGVQYLYINEPGKKLFNEYYFNTAELDYKRVWIKESKLAPILYTELKFNYIPSAEFRDLSESHGGFQFRATSTKNINNFYLTSQLRYQINERATGNDYLIREYTRIYLIPGYTFNNYLGAELTTYWHEENLSGKPKRGPRKSGFVRVVPGLDLYLSQNIMFNLYASFKVAKSHDQQILRENWEKDPILGLNMTATIF